MHINLSVEGLERFLEAQGPVYAQVLDELSLGRKESHWIWFIFPQLKALGRSAMAKHFGLESKAQALAYWHHPVLGKRLVECTRLLLDQPDSDVFEIFGSPDDLKFRSCMTLFHQVAPQEPVFQQALVRFFHGKPDEATLAFLKQHA